jgi:hypothetical protein
VDASTGQYRCDDPSCIVTQCGQCNKEENRVKRANRQAAARRQKDEEERAACEKARKDMAAGKVYVWTEDADAYTDVAVESASVMSNLQQIEASGKVQQGEEAAVCTEEKGDAAGSDSDSVFEKEKKTDRRMLPEQGAKTVWCHKTRLMLYSCICKFDPFGAPVKKDAWAKVATEMANSTKLLWGGGGPDLRVKTDGHGLEVFYQRRCNDRQKKLEGEEKTSGQAGHILSGEEKTEFQQLEACIAKEKSAAMLRDKKRNAKKVLEDLRNNEVTQRVREAAIGDELVRKKTFKVLQTKVRAAKLEAKVWEQQHNALGKYQYNEQQLKDIEELQRFKDEGFGSEALDSVSEEADVKKGGIVARSIADLANKFPDLSGTLSALDPAKFAQSFFAARQQCMPQKRTLKERLDDVAMQRQLGLITKEEAEEFMQAVKRSYFLEDR